jgi:hypothetical protein
LSPFFRSIFDELERQRVEILDRVKTLPDEKFNYKPSDEKWSISQILTHILVAEQLSVGYMKKKALGITQLENSGLSAGFRLQILIISQRIPSLKFKAPGIVLANTPQAYPMAELQSRWEAHRQDLQVFLDGIENQHEKKVLYKHPVAGRLDARQAMVFFREHIIHHLPQIKRLLDHDL